MKFKYLAAMLLAGTSLSLSAQGYKDGVEYYKAERFNNAKELLERNLNAPGTDKAASYYYLGMIASRQGDQKTALDDFNKGVAENAEYPYNYVGLGLLSLKNGDAKGAEANFKLAEKYAKKDASVEVAIARAYYTVNPNLYAKEVEKRMQKAYKKNGQNPDYFIFLGEQYYDQKDWGNANANFDQAINFAPQVSEAYVRYADIISEVNQKSRIQTLMNLLSANPQSALGQRELALAYYDQKNYKAAADAYGKYVQNPNHFDRDEARYSLLLFSNGDYQKGYDYASQLLRQNPDNFEALCYQYRNASQLDALKDKRLPLAEKVLAAHKANPAKNEMAQIDFNLIGSELTNDNRPDEAIEVYKEAIAQYPDVPYFRKQYALTYVEKENYAQAAKLYQDYLSKVENPGYADLLQAAKLAYFGAVTTENDAALVSSLVADAQKYADLAAKADATQYAPYKTMGDAKIAGASEKDKAQVAVADYEKALSLLNALGEPTKYKNDGRAICLYLGNYALNQQNNKAKAIDYFKQALTFDPTNTDIQGWLSKMK